MDKAGRVVLIDLNASRMENESERDTVIMGTVGYAAGALLNVMLTRSHPTEAFAPGRAGRIVRKCTSLNPGDRYQTALHLRDVL